MYLKRKVEAEIKQWINSKNKKPLVIIGSRQCGKTTTIKELAYQNYQHVCYWSLKDKDYLKQKLQLEANPSIQQLLILLKQIYPGVEFNQDTIIIIDEIQEVIDIFEQLKVVNEKYAHLNFVVLGSYLGTKIFTHNSSYPVGQIKMIEMFSMSFEEFLINVNDLFYEQLIQEYEAKNIREATHQIALDYFFIYLVLGGFPEVIKTFIMHQATITDEVYAIRNGIYEDYANDIYKYIDDDKKLKVSKIFKYALQTMGYENNNFKLTTMDKCARFKDYEYVIALIEASHICFKVDNSQTLNLPLSPRDRINKFKLYFNDISLIASYFDLRADLLPSKEFDIIKGNLIENYVMLELLRNKHTPYYHTFKHHNNQYEIDALYVKDLKVHTLEIKSGKHTKSVSMNLLNTLNQDLKGYVISLKKDITEYHLPLYLAFKL